MSLLSTLPEGQTVVVVGDVMLDHYVFGDTDRVSPEAPVPVINVTEEKYILGGAANVAAKVTELGGHAILVGFIGVDEDGIRLDEMLRNFDEERMTPMLVTVPERCTTRKMRCLSRGQQLLRLDYEVSSVVSDSIWLELVKTFREAVKDADAVILQDYDKGVLTKRSISDMMRAWGPDLRPMLVDPKTKNMDAYIGCSAIKLNKVEAEEAIHGKFGTDASFEHAARQISEELGGADVYITRGSQGITAFSDGTVYQAGTTAQSVIDVTGAGDAAAAAMAIAMAAGWAFPAVAAVANEAGGRIVGQVGNGTLIV